MDVRRSIPSAIPQTPQAGRLSFRLMGMRMHETASDVSLDFWRGDA